MSDSGASSRAALLSECTANAHARWPKLVLADEQFSRYLLDRMIGTEPSAENPVLLHSADLYLACACSIGDREALQSFEALCFPELVRAVAREPKLATSLDDIKQQLREKLFVRVGGRPAKIEEFNGRSSLQTWFRVIVTRTLINLGTRGPKERPMSDDALSALPLLESDPELQYMKEHYRNAFAEAFGHATGALESRCRNLLRYSLVENLNIDQIALIHSVHRSTAARWLTEAREQLMRELKRALGEQLKMAPEEFDEVLHLIRSRIEISLERVFAGATSIP